MLLGSKLENGTLTIAFLPIIFDGHLNTIAFEEIKPTLLKRIKKQEYNRIIFDLSGITYIASNFIHLCISTAKMVGENRFSIKNTTPKVKKIFKIAMLDDKFTIY